MSKQRYAARSLLLLQPCQWDAWLGCSFWSKYDLPYIGIMCLSNLVPMQQLNCCLIWAQTVSTQGLQPYRAARLDSWRLSAQQTGKGKPSTSQASSSSSGTRKKDAGPPDSAYPSRSSMSGGWAGGEKGLQAFLEARAGVVSHCSVSAVVG